MGILYLLYLTLPLSFCYTQTPMHHMYVTCTPTHNVKSVHIVGYLYVSVVFCDFSSSPLLSWRDVQHIIVKTSRAGHLNAPDWKTNAAGYNGA